uniref:hypothetical protein n=1 Tax=Prevotella sp. TaxID=59823 RepID=UPI0040264A6E
MKKLFNPFMSLALFVVTFSSCSSFETVEEFKTSKSVSSNEIKAFEEYGKAIDDNFEAFLETRDIISRASEEKTDSVINIQSSQAIQRLKPASKELFDKLNITDHDFKEAVKELLEEENLDNPMTVDELRCFAALGLYDTYLADVNVQKPNITRASYMDYLSCIGVGMTLKEILSLPNKQLIKFFGKKMLGRAVPYIGWGWAAISAYDCIRKL